MCVNLLFGVDKSKKNPNNQKDDDQFDNRESRACGESEMQDQQSTENIDQGLRKVIATAIKYG